MREAIDMPKLASLADARGRRRANGAAAGHAEETAGYDLGDDADDREEIDCTPGRRDRVVDHGMTIFASHPAVYARGGQLVRVVRADKLGQHDRLRTDAERLLIAPCLAEWIATELARRVVFRKWDRRARKSIACDPPSWLAPAMLADGEFEGVRHLQGITSAPVLRPDGSVHSTPGYDAMTGMLLAAKGTLPMIPHAPPKDVAAAALARLRVLLGGYVWGDDFSEAVALSLLLTKVARHLMPTAPLHLFTSPTAGSGKTQISEAASIIADGVNPSLCSWPGDDEEMRKAISTALLAGESFVVFDNIANGKTLRSAALDKTLTASIVGDRLLKTMDRLTLVNGAVWAATGNNIVPCADMVRRTIVARIDPRTERPWERRFDWTPAGYAREHRAELLAAALTILAAHLQANTAPLAPPLQSFDAWSRIVRDALLWLGMPDAVRSQDAIADEDPDAEDRAELIGALRRQYGTTPFTAEDVAQTVRQSFGASESSDVGRLASAVNARLNGKPATGLRVGYVLRAIKDQVSNGAALRGRLDKHAGVVRWRIDDTR
jgi:putative DNA primase/helicase